ncbi:MAG: hypothetical protein ACTSQJ_00480 [Promethearchaeota archaeon]
MDNKFIKKTLKLIKLKLQGIHPTKKQIVSFCRKYRQDIHPILVGDYNETEPFDEDDPDGASYYQYLLLTIYSPISSSHISVSSLPYRELIDLFKINPVEDWVDECEIDEYIIA